MITDLTLLKMPFTDGVPEDVEQKRIDWIKNGDALTAASTKYGSEGRLNSAPYGINKNVETNAANDILIASKINEIALGVNNINTALDVSVDVNVVKQIGLNKTNIETLQTDTQKIEDDVSELQINTEHTTEEIGVYNPELDSTYKTIRGDLLWIKTEMGKYPGQDINGQIVIDGQASGMKARIMANTDQILKTDARVSALETQVTDSDVGALTLNVNKIREELGPTSSAKFNTVYTRLSNNETDISGIKSDVSSIKTFIGFTNQITLDARVTTLETSNTKINNTLYTTNTGVVDQLNALTVKVGTSSDPLSLEGKIVTMGNDVNAMYTIIGKDTSSGMRSDIAWINQQIGMSQTGGTPPSDSILGRLTTLTTNTGLLANSVQDLQVEIGSSTEGIKGQVNTLNTKMNGNGTTGTTIESLGVFAYSKSIGTQVDAKVSEAPTDGKTYARKNKAWSSIAIAVGRFTKDTYTFDLSGGASNVPFSSLTASAFNSGVTVASNTFVVNDAGIFRIKLNAEIASLTQNVKFEIKVNGTTAFSNQPLTAFAFGNSLFASADDLVKLVSGDAITVSVSSIAGDTNVVLNNLKISLTPIA